MVVSEFVLSAIRNCILAITVYVWVCVGAKMAGGDYQYKDVVMVAGVCVRNQQDVIAVLTGFLVFSR